MEVAEKIGLSDEQTQAAIDLMTLIQTESSESVEIDRDSTSDDSTMVKEKILKNCFRSNSCKIG